jgi:hypothetical protein
MNDQRRSSAGPDRHDPLMPPGGDGKPRDPGAYIGHEPELARETIPGGVKRGDRRVSAVATQPTGAGARAHTQAEADGGPSGHREGPAASDDQVREAGQNR